MKMAHVASMLTAAVVIATTSLALMNSARVAAQSATPATAPAPSKAIP